MTSLADLPEDAAPDVLLRAAETLASPPTNLPIAEPAWVALPTRRLTSPSRDERRAAIARLMVWAKAGGATWDGIELRVDANGHGAIVAGRPLLVGESILTLPRALMIVDDEVAAATPDPGDALAAWLPLALRDPTSRWRAYLDALPVELAELPMFHPAEDLAAIAGTSAYTIAAAANRDVRDAYDRMSSERRARVSLAEFAWGWAIVKSRAYHAPGSFEHRIALLPVVDMFDHRLGDTTWSYDPNDGNFVVHTERAFAIGDPVHFTYGDRSNTRLFVHFGFTVPNNPADEACLRFERPEDPITRIAAHLLWKLPLDAPALMPVSSILDHRFVRALSLARLHAAGPVERARATEAGLSEEGDLPWLGATLEAAALAVMARAARRAIAELETHAAPAPTDAWGRTCAIVRDGERAVLEQICELARVAPAYLAGRDRAHILAAAAAVPAGARLLRQYLEAVADEVAGP